MKSSVKTLGASNLSTTDRAENDHYSTNPKYLEKLLEQEHFDKNIWECACGCGGLSMLLESKGYNVTSSDIVNRGYKKTEIFDFLSEKRTFDGDIITNPPYTYGLEFVKQALDNIKDGHKVCFLLRLQFLESVRRYRLFKDYPPKTIYVSVKRIACNRNGETISKSSAISYAWFVWEKGFKGSPTIRWFND